MLILWHKRRLTAFNILPDALVYSWRGFWDRYAALVNISHYLVQHCN